MKKSTVFWMFIVLGGQFYDCFIIDINLMQIQAMRVLKKPGVIINLGSAAGLYPMFADPIYSATKGMGLHVYLCP